jgi:beta-lactamase class A
MILALALAAAIAVPPVDATVGYSALHVESGRTVSSLGDQPFPMGSVYKFAIAIETLRQVDDGNLDLAREVRVTPEQFAPGWSPLRDEAAGKPVTLTLANLVERMVRDSDNTACDVILGIIGGPAAVTRRMHELELPAIRIDRTETQIGADLDAPDGVASYWTDRRDTATPDALVELFRKFHARETGLSRSSHRLLLRHLTDTVTGPRRIKSALPEGALLAHKTGSMPGVANDAGVITSPDGKDHIVIAIFTKGRKTSTTEEIDDAIAAVARQVYEEFLPK